MPTAATGLTIALRRLNDGAIAYHDNPFSQRLAGHPSEFSSYIIRGRSGEAVEVLIKFSKDYRLHGARGVRITIPIGYGEQDPSFLKDTQSFWVDEDNLYQARTFTRISRWRSETSKAAASRFLIPRLDLEPDRTSRNTLWQELGIANKGCIAVFVTRGDLENGEVQLRQGRETDPPASHQFRATDIPKVISFDWFKPHENHGEVTIMEFRNLGNIDAGHIASGAGAADMTFGTPRAASVTLNDGADSDDENAYSTDETTTPPPRSTLRPSLRARHAPLQPLTIPMHSHEAPLSTHTNGVPHRFTISTRTSSLESAAPHTDQESASSTQDGRLCHVTARPRGTAINQQSVKPGDRNAAAAWRIRQEGIEKKTTSQHTIKSAHRRKRTAPAGGQSDRVGPGDGTGAKRPRCHQDGATASNGSPAKSRAMAHASVDLTIESDAEDLIEVKVEAGKRACGREQARLSTQEIEERIYKLELKEELLELKEELANRKRAAASRRAWREAKAEAQLAEAGQSADVKKE